MATPARRLQCWLGWNGDGRRRRGSVSGGCVVDQRVEAASWISEWRRRRGSVSGGGVIVGSLAASSSAHWRFRHRRLSGGSRRNYLAAALPSPARSAMDRVPLSMLWFDIYTRICSPRCGPHARWPSASKGCLCGCRRGCWACARPHHCVASGPLSRHAPRRVTRPCRRPHAHAQTARARSRLAHHRAGPFAAARTPA